MDADQADALEPKRWYCLTPGRVVAGLLPLEGLLWLSGRYHWFAFNEHKGWTVLIALGAVLLAILVMLLWFVAALLFRWRFQFSIRTLLLLTVVVALPCTWFFWEVEKASEQREVVKMWLELGGGVDYDYRCDVFGYPIPGVQPPGPAWLRRLVSDHFFADVAEVGLLGPEVTDEGLERLKGLGQLRLLYLCGGRVTDGGLKHLKALGRLKMLGLGDTKITDAGLEHLKGLRQLRELDLSGTQVTDEGVKRLQQALPKCTIDR